MARAGSTIDSTVRDGSSSTLPEKKPEPALTNAPGKSRIAEGQHKLGETKDKTGKTIMSKIDEVDLKIENEASKAKGGISSWFGGK